MLRAGARSVKSNDTKLGCVSCTRAHRHGVCAGCSGIGGSLRRGSDQPFGATPVTRQRGTRERAARRGACVCPPKRALRRSPGRPSRRPGCAGEARRACQRTAHATRQLGSTRHAHVLHLVGGVDVAHAVLLAVQQRTAHNLNLKVASGARRRLASHGGLSRERLLNLRLDGPELAPVPSAQRRQRASVGARGTLRQRCDNGGRSRGRSSCTRHRVAEARTRRRSTQRG